MNSHPHSNIHRRVRCAKKSDCRMVTPTSMTMTPIYSIAMAIFSVAHQSVSTKKKAFDIFQPLGTTKSETVAVALNLKEKNMHLMCQILSF